MHIPQCDIIYSLSDMVMMSSTFKIGKTSVCAICLHRCKVRKSNFFFSLTWGVTLGEYIAH